MPTDNHREENQTLVFDTDTGSVSVAKMGSALVSENNFTFNSEIISTNDKLSLSSSFYFRNQRDP